MVVRVIEAKEDKVTMADLIADLKKSNKVDYSGAIFTFEGIVRGKEENTDPSEILHVSKRSGSWENGKNCRETEDGGAGRKNHGYLWECSAAACLYVCT